MLDSVAHKIRVFIIIFFLYFYDRLRFHADERFFYWIRDNCVDTHDIHKYKYNNYI